MNENQNLNNNLCKTCKYKFRRVFMPLKPEMYEDEDGNPILSNEDNIIITNQCLLTSMDLDGEITIECDSYKSREDRNKESVTFFKHLT